MLNKLLIKYFIPAEPPTSIEEQIIKPAPVEEEVHLLDSLVVLAKRSRMIIYTTAVVMILAYVYLFISPNTYVASARWLPPQQNITLNAQMLNSLGGGVTLSVGSRVGPLGPGQGPFSPKSLKEGA